MRRKNIKIRTPLLTQASSNLMAQNSTLFLSPGGSEITSLPAIPITMLPSIHFPPNNPSSYPTPYPEFHQQHQRQYSI